MKKSNKIMTIVLSMLLMISGFFAMPFKKASAVESPLGNDVYYYSDNPASVALRQRILSEGNVDSVNLTYQSTRDTFSAWLNVFYEQNAYQNIEDSYVIFEVTYYEYFEKDYWQEFQTNEDTYVDFTEILDTIFTTMQDNGCKIMFICGVSEAYFNTRNAFLDEVDIHINTDLFFIFMTSILYDVVEDCNTMRISNCTFLIDKMLSYNIQMGYKSNRVFRDYLMLLIRHAYKEDIQAHDMPNYQVLLEKNIRFVCELEEGDYFDAVMGDLIGEWDNDNYVTFYEEYIRNEHMYAIGSTHGSSNATQGEEWANFIAVFQTSINEYFPIYIYNPMQYTFDEVDTPYFYQGGTRSSLFFTVMEDFLTDEPLEEYNNWTGRCQITFMDIAMGYGGWMRNIFAEGEDEFGFAELFLKLDWNSFGEDEAFDYDYYFNYDDSWPA